MTLTQAIQAAGGLATAGARDAVTIKRPGEWKRKFDLGRIEAKQDHDLVLLPSDTIEVPASRGKKVEAPRPTKSKPRKGPVVPPL
jgi:protein involved in polysaccharide export with SLBB domain